MNRRQFLSSALAAGAALGSGLWARPARAQAPGPNDKLNVACIGVQNRAAANVAGVASENVVALCDIDENYLGQAAQQYPGAATYYDFRRLLDDADSIDAVVVSTPDHVHAPASLWAMELGKHVYCEKPLTHNVFEARRMALTAAEYGVATQMGTQIHATDNYRRVVEIVRSGVIGDITEVQVWVNKAWGGGELPTETPPVPEHIHWDAWLGPAPERPYHPVYLPGNWRRWWDFGGGTLGDMACHVMDLPFWALGLRHPRTVEADGPPVHPETCPLGMQVTYIFDGVGDNPPCRLVWSDGDRVPAEINGVPVPGMGVMFLGSKGMLFADYGRWELHPRHIFEGYEPPEPTIPSSIGHYQEWIQACKEGTPTTCNFDYSGALTEAVLLGNVAYRVGEKLEWDADTLTVSNVPGAEEYIGRVYRDGWLPPAQPEYQPRKHASIARPRANVA
jgi:predicted dehydrogenase